MYKKQRYSIKRDFIDKMESPNIRTIFKSSSNDWKKFMYSFHKHMSPSQLLDNIIQNRDISIEFCIYWAKYFWDDFIDSDLRDRMIDFLTGVSHVKIEEINQYISKRIIPIDFIINNKDDIDLLNFNNQLLAEQLTYFSFCLLRRIKYYEFTYHTYQKCIPYTIDQYYTFGHKFRGYIIRSILRYDDPIKRADTIQRFIEIASKLYKMDNYNALVEIIKGLRSDPIKRLSNTWKHISSKYIKSFDKFNSLTSDENNFMNIRYHKHSGKNTIPYITAYLNEIEKHFENDDYNRFISTIDYLRKQQSIELSFTHDPLIFSKLNNLPITHDDDLYAESFYKEPQERDNHSLYEKIANDLRSNIKNRLSEQHTFRKVNILLGGQSGVGKSAIIKAVFNEDIKSATGVPQTTNITKYDLKDKPVVIYDVPGAEFGKKDKYMDETVKFLTNVNTLAISNPYCAIHCVWYVIAGPRINDEELMMIKEIYGQLDSNGKPRYKLFILLNKIDTDSSDNIQILMDIINKGLHDCKSFYGCFPVIADRNFNLINFGELSSNLPKSWANFSFRIEKTQDNATIFFYNSDTHEVHEIKLQKSYGFEKLINETSMLLDEMVRSTFIASQYISIKMKDDMAKDIINYYYNTVKKDRIAINSLTGQMIRELMNIWLSHNNIVFIRNDKTKNKLLSLLCGLIVSKKGTFNMLITGIAIHDYLRHVAVESLNVSDDVEQINYDDKFNKFKEIFEDYHDSNDQQLKNFIKSLWNEGSPDIMIQKVKKDNVEFKTEKALISGDYNTVIQLYSKLLGDKPTFDIFNKRATVYILLKQYDNAISDIDAMIKIDYFQSQPHVKKGQVLAAKGDYGGALNEFNIAKGIHDDPEIDNLIQRTNKQIDDLKRGILV